MTDSDSAPADAMPDESAEDPRKLRSRGRLIDAAITLLTTGGVEAVTIDAVTAASRVARTTLYRNFGSSRHLLAATFEKLIPPVELPPVEGNVRDRLVALLTQQAELIDAAPLQLTTLGWLALGPQGASAHDETTQSLRARVIRHYREPFDVILDTDEARRELADIDRDLFMAQLIGPIAFAKLVGLPAIGAAGCAHIVDDLLTARAPGLVDRRD